MSVQEIGAMTYPATADTIRWASSARRFAQSISTDPDARTKHLRYQGTWFVGVDALPNDGAGCVGGLPFKGPWATDLPADLPLHPAQLSITYCGYPQQDPEQSAANHRYRIRRSAAHIDGLLPEGPDRRRYAREFHAYVLGVHLDAVPFAPTVYWAGSHVIMREALKKAVQGRDVAQVDLTEPYQAARAQIFETCEKIALTPKQAGDAFLLDRFTLHGTEPWIGPLVKEGRMIAFFRPCLPSAEDWFRSG